MPRPLRLYGRNEVRVDTAVHIAGILFAINASLWLLAHATDLIEEVPSGDWMTKVYDPQIRPNMQRLYKKPGYKPF